MGKTAIVIGATGLTGGILTQLLLKDDRYSRVKLFSRSAFNIEHPKLKEYLINMDSLLQQRSLFTGDEMYCCIGTTKAKTPDTAQYRKIDYDIPVHAARLCKENGIPTYCVISSLGADTDSRIFYSRLKGEMEAAVKAIGITNTIILRPSLIAGNRAEKRPAEKFGKIMMNLLNPLLLGPLKVYRSIHPETIARAMVILANQPLKKSIYLSDDIQGIADHGH